MSETRRDQQLTLLALALAVLINLVAIDQPLMGDDDATLYASIAAAMVRTGDYFGLYAWGQDWLDKPHLPFWFAAASFRLFGISVWAYRLPAVLCLFGAAYYTFRLGTRLYGGPVGLWAAIILLTAEHTILSSADVRAEPYVTFFVIACTWYLVRVAEDDRWLTAAIVGGVFAAAALISKGPFTIIPVVGAIGGNWLLRGGPKIHWRRWVLVGIVAIIGITPELWALHVQFDTHPEKVVFDRSGVSGTRFFLWDSQFGRFFGTGPIHQTKGRGSRIFFVHTFFWVFLPWCFVMVLAAVRRARALWARQAALVEWYTVFGAALMFVVFSASRFQLPHYLNIIFPFMAILTASELYARTSPGEVRLLHGLQIGLLVVMVSIGAALGWLARPDHATSVTIASLLLVVAMLVAWRASGGPGVKVLVTSVLAAVAVNLYLERGIYPTMLEYDAGPIAARFVNERYPDVAVIVPRDHHYTGFDFGLARKPAYIEHLADTGSVTARPYLLLVPNRDAPDPRTVQSFDHFLVTRPTLRFLNRRTRPQAVDRVDLVLVAGPAPGAARPQSGPPASPSRH
ncbi:MAG: glycosyltransferase family 39 protein [Gemmatimonadota bacterium]